MTKRAYRFSSGIWLAGLLPLLAVVILLMGLTAATAAPAGAPPPGYCDDSLHDPTKWHPPVDPVTGCYYGHEHGDNPNPPGSPFVPLVFGGDEATPNENHYKHNGYKVYYGHRNSPDRYTPNSDPCDDVRFRIHMDVTPRERVGRYHSYEMAMAHCADGQLDVSYLQGWADFSTIVHPSRSGDPGTRPIKFAPTAEDWQRNGLNVWEVWYGRTGLGLDVGVLMGEAPTIHFNTNDPDNPSTWVWTGGAGRLRKLENFQWYGWREPRRGEFWTDVYGNTVNPNSDFCKSNTCLRQYISPLLDREPNRQVLANWPRDINYDVRGVRFPATFPIDGGRLPWASGDPVPQPPTNTPEPPITTPDPLPPTDTPPPVDPNEPTVQVVVNPAAAAPGEAVQVSLNLLNVSGLYGMQAECVTNAGVLAGVSASEGDVFTQADSLIVDKGFNPADGTWLIAGTRRNPNPAFSGSGAAFRLNYAVQGAGSSAVSCAVVGVDSDGNEVPLKVVNGSFNGEQPPAPPTDTPAPPPTDTPAPPPPDTPVPPPSQLSTINGAAAYQNRPDSAGIIVRLLDGGQNMLAEVVTGASGAYSFTNVPAGVYTITLSGMYHLTGMQPVAVESDGQVVEVAAYTLMAGDTNNDGVINLEDAALVGANFGLTVPPAPDGTDLNGDARVDIRDLALIGGNFGQSGAAQ